MPFTHSKRSTKVCAVPIKQRDYVNKSSRVWAFNINRIVLYRQSTEWGMYALFGALFVCNERLIANDCMGQLEETKMEFTNEQLNKIDEYANVLDTSSEDIKNQLSKLSENNYLPLNLQFFAEGSVEEGEGEGSGHDEGQGEGAGTGEEEGEGKETFTRSEVDSEISKAVNTALENRDAKHQKDLQQAVNDALAEKERLSKLSEKERKDEELSKREKDLEKRLADIERKELLADAVSDLNKKELPAEFAEVLLGEDAESTLKNINTFKESFDKAVNDAVKEKLRQDTPPAGGGGVNLNSPNFGKQLAQMNKNTGQATGTAQHNYFNDGGN